MEEKRKSVGGIKEAESCQLVFTTIFILYPVLKKVYKTISGIFMSSLFTSIILRQCEMVFLFTRGVAALNRKKIDRILLVVFA
jgi:hypothetical protein